LNLPTDALAKFQEICMTKLRCPTNTLRYTKRFQGSPLPMESRGEQPFTLSYLTPAFFQLHPSGSFSILNRVEVVGNSEPVALPAGYRPRVDRIGPFPSSKAFTFEGARYYDPAISGFDYTTVTNAAGLSGSPQGNFASRGTAFMGQGEPYTRESTRPSKLFKQASLRHSNRTNVGMFDGHVEQLDNVKSADPSYFLPSRSIIKSPAETWHFTVGPAESRLRKPGALIN
jgi:prepilin-type processing-associated H-X9-DG protein